jgi:hypothetical protein
MMGPVQARALRAIAIGAAAMAVLAPSAGATIVDGGKFSGSETGVPDSLCGIDLVRDSTFSGSFLIRASTGGQAFFLHQVADFRDAFTNPVNDRSMVFQGHSLINELTATQVDGNVYEFKTIEAGVPFEVRDGAGNLVLRDRGVIRHVELFDTLGDGAPGGVVIDDQIVGVGGPHPALDQTDAEFCAMVTALVG